MTSCAATTTIREALEETRDFLPPLFREPADDPTHVAARVALALDALALLEQLVEAAQAWKAADDAYWSAKPTEEMERALETAAYVLSDALRACTKPAVAAVGPGQKEET